MVSRTLIPVLAAALTLAGCANRMDSQPMPDADLGGASVKDTWQMTTHAPGAPTGLPEPTEHVGTTHAWGEPNIVPAGLEKHPRAVAETDGPYLLDSGDRLRVFVYGQPNLSRLYTVDHAGNIVVPLIGRVKARGATVYRVAGRIRSRLAAEFVRDPQVTVDIFENRPFFILGEVGNAGQYPYVSGMTVTTAVAIAGGFSERASRRHVILSRRINGLMEVIEAPLDYVVKPGDTIEVKERFF
ncbi:MAG: polysaccharide biosynthesis/export family protein [Pseudomonadota bacterium]